MKEIFFWKSYSVFLAGIFIIVGSISFFKPAWLIPGIWGFIVFFTLLIPLVYFLAMAGVRKNDGSSVLIILAANVVKMLISLTLCAFYILKFGAEPVIFAANFFLLYIVFTLFEIYSLLHNLRLPNQENNSSNK